MKKVVYVMVGFISGVFIMTLICLATNYKFKEIFDYLFRTYNKESLWYEDEATAQVRRFLRVKQTLPSNVNVDSLMNLYCSMGQTHYEALEGKVNSSRSLVLSEDSMHLWYIHNDDVISYVNSDWWSTVIE